MKPGVRTPLTKCSTAPRIGKTYDVNVYLNYKNCWCKYKKNENSRREIVLKKWINLFGRNYTTQFGLRCDTSSL